MSVQLSDPEYVRRQIERYQSELPKQLWNLLLPFVGDNLADFAASIKRLRIYEQERNYVMAIQRHFGISIRPNESVRESMTRARAKILSRNSINSRRSRDRRLPQDPLE